MAPILLMIGPLAHALANGTDPTRELRPSERQKYGPEWLRSPKGFVLYIQLSSRYII